MKLNTVNLIVATNEKKAFYFHICITFPQHQGNRTRVVCSHHSSLLLCHAEAQTEIGKLQNSLFLNSSIVFLIDRSPVGKEGASETFASKCWWLPEDALRLWKPSKPPQTTTTTPNQRVFQAKAGT